VGQQIHRSETLKRKPWKVATTHFNKTRKPMKGNSYKFDIKKCSVTRLLYQRIKRWQEEQRALLSQHGESRDEDGLVVPILRSVRKPKHVFQGTTGEKHKKFPWFLNPGTASMRLGNVSILVDFVTLRLPPVRKVANNIITCIPSDRPANLFFGFQDDPRTRPFGKPIHPLSKKKWKPPTRKLLA